MRATLRPMLEYRCEHEKCRKVFQSRRVGRRFCSDRCRDRRVRDPAALSLREQLMLALRVCPLNDDCGEGPGARLAEHVLYEHGLDPDRVFADLQIGAPLLPSFRTTSGSLA